MRRLRWTCKVQTQVQQAHRTTSVRGIGAQEANEPAPGTDDYWRICTPYPFDLWLSVADAAHAFELRIDELESFAYFSPGTQPFLSDCGRLPCQFACIRMPKDVIDARGGHVGCSVQQQQHKSNVQCEATSDPEKVFQDSSG